MKIKDFIDKQDLIHIAAVFIITRILILLIGAISFSIFPQNGSSYQKRTTAQVLNVQNAWDKFDSGWYIKGAKEGYPQRAFTDDRQETWGFMPLYPMSIKVLSKVFGPHYFWIGIIFSNICSFLALLVIYKLLKEKFGQGVETINLFLISAGSFYLSIVYAEGLFVLLTSLVFYLSHKKKYGWALIFAGLATVTRIQGCILFVIPGIEILVNTPRTFYKYIPAFLVSIIPLGLFMWYLKATSGDPLAFLNIQAAWGSPALFPLQGFIGLIKGDRLITSTINVGFWVMNLGLVLSCYKKLPLSYVLFTLAYFLLSTSNEVVYGATRYMLGVIPIFIAVMMSNKYVYQFFVVLNILFLAITIAAFVTQTGTFI